MSLPDHLLDDDEPECACGLPPAKGRGLCLACQSDIDDLYADADIQDELDK